MRALKETHERTGDCNPEAKRVRVPRGVWRRRTLARMACSASMCGGRRRQRMSCPRTRSALCCPLSPDAGHASTADSKTLGAARARVL